MALSPQQISQSNQQFGSVYNSLPGNLQSSIPSIGQNNQMPAYLQGTQTGAGLFGQDPNQLQSSIPSINGQNNYIPGAGMVPYAAQSGTGSVYQSAIAQGMSPEMAGYMQRIRDYSSSQGGLSTVPSVGGTVPGASGPAASGSNIPSVTGATAGGWMSPEQLRTQTNSLQSYVSPNSGGGGGGSGGTQLGNAADKNATGGALPIGNQPTQNLNPNFNPATGQYSPTPVNYSPIGGNGGTYTAPGQAQGQNGAGVLQMQQQSPQDALQGYMNTPGYQLLMTNQQNQFQQSPGYQYAVNQALQNVQNNASARGLLESGSVMREMTDRAQGMASQGYNDWWNKQNSAFNDYQNRLAGLAGGNVGGDQAFNLGQSLGQNTYQTGSDVGTLFGNQGTAGLGAIAGTGAAQAGNIGNAGTQQAQIAGANASTQLAGATYNRGLF